MSRIDFLYCELTQYIYNSRNLMSRIDKSYHGAAMPIYNSRNLMSRIDVLKDAAGVYHLQ